jgi:hypothetical protein
MLSIRLCCLGNCFAGTTRDFAWFQLNAEHHLSAIIEGINQTLDYESRYTEFDT